MQVVKATEPWAISHEQTYHMEAIQTYGERISLRRVWNLKDFTAGRTTRCTVCQAGDDDTVKARMAGLYKQAGETYCESCYGTGFTGGFETTSEGDPVTYITYMLAHGTPSEWKRDRSGEMQPDRPEVQFSSDPQLDPGDLIVRYTSWVDEDTPGTENERLVCTSVSHISVRTGLMRSNPSIWVSQFTDLENLPQQDPRYAVEVL